MVNPRKLTSCKRVLPIAALSILGMLACITPACGGGAGGEAAGRGLALVSFSLDGVDNAVLNQVLIFNFSGAVDPASVSLASIQIREGPAFGISVHGVYVVDGATVRFEPRLPTLCDLSDGGFKPDTQYRVQVIGFPEEFAVRNSAGQPLNSTATYEFHMREESDPTKYADQIPGVNPMVVSNTPENGSQAVSVIPGNKIEIVMSENLNPCSVSDATVLFHMYETGDPLLPNAVDAPNGNASGFYSGTDTSDQAPLDHTTWGATTATPWTPPQKILAKIELVQSVAETRIVITPLSGYNPDPAKSAPVFPENALLVVELTFGIMDFGNQPLTPKIFSFTTQNFDTMTGQYLLENEGETPYLDSGTTADVDTARAPGRVQGFMLFSGDADNGDFLDMPSGPDSVASGCTVPLQANNGVKDEFDPPDGFLLDTGSTPNTCLNSTDGSTAVVWEFLTFTIRSGVTVRVVGVNPAIILVTGEVSIESGGLLLVRGDGNAGAPDGEGRRGRDMSSQTDIVNPGGSGVAGGGNGGNATKVEGTNQDWKYGNDGNAGFGSDDYDPAMVQILPLDDGSTVEPLGGGQGGAPVGTATSSPWDGGSEAGGGGGHSEPGTDGQYSHGATTNWVLKLARRAKGGRVYGDDNDPMLLPFAGSGGGAAGQAKDQPWRSYVNEGVGGGTGGAGGGFLDLTASGDIIISGTIDAAGSRGGNGRGWRTEANPDRGVSGGGGGGSGGGIRLLTPRDIVLGATSVLTTAGGVGGTGSKPYSVVTRSHGGPGGNGRIAMEDSDSIIAGQAGATLVPAEGDAGFYRGAFDATRFQGGGLTPGALTDVFPVGPFNPNFTVPVSADFIAALPVAGAPGAGKTGILIEMRGYEMGADALPDMASETDWFSVGYFKDTGIESLPEWNTGHPADITRAADNSGDGIDHIDGCEFIQIRMTIYLKDTIKVVDPGGLLDDWTIRFTSNQ